jgi:hypothetical protein
MDYNSNLKYLVPILGVLVGWILTSLTGFLKGMTDKQKILAKALTQLHFIYLEQNKLLRHFEYLKDMYGISPDYEKMRFRAMERYVLSNNNLKISLDIVSELSTINPMKAMELKTLIEGYSFSQKMKFSEASTNSEIYLKLLSSFEVMFEIEHEALKKIILNLSFEYGIITWLKMRRKYHNIDKSELNMYKILGTEDEIKKYLAEFNKKN